MAPDVDEKLDAGLVEPGDELLAVVGGVSNGEDLPHHPDSIS